MVVDWTDILAVNYADLPIVVDFCIVLVVVFAVASMVVDGTDILLVDCVDVPVVVDFSVVVETVELDVVEPA